MSTRIGDCAQDYGTVGFQSTDFEKLGTEDSLELLLKCANVSVERRGDVEEDAQQMVGDDILCQHALAITQAGAFIKKNLSTFKEYPALFKKQRKYLLKYHQKRARSRYGDVYATFEVSAEAMEHSKQNDWKKALELLKILAFLHREGVQEEMFTRAWTTARRTAEEEPNDNIESCSQWHVNYMRKFLLNTQNSPRELDILSLRKARSVLHSFSLITVDPDSGDISMHPLVHAWAKDRLEADKRLDAWATTASILKLSIGSDHEYAEFFDRIQSHVESCFATRPEHLFDNLNDVSLEIDRVLYSFTWVMHRLHNDGLAKDISDIIYSRIGHEIVPQSRQWREAMYLQAVCMLQVNKYNEALATLDKIVLYDREYLLLEDSNSLEALDLLGSTYQKLGKYQQAIELLGEVVQIERKTLAYTNPSRLMSLHRLGTAYLKNKQVDKAIKLLEEIVQIWGKTLASTHPNRLASLHELGRAYIRNEQVDKAIELLEEVAQIRGQTLASTNHSRLISEYMLALAYYENDDYQKALPLIREVARIRSEILEAGDQYRVQTEKLLSYCLESIEEERLESGSDNNTRSPGD